MVPALAGATMPRVRSVRILSIGPASGIVRVVGTVAPPVVPVGGALVVGAAPVADPVVVDTGPEVGTAEVADRATDQKSEFCLKEGAVM